MIALLFATAALAGAQADFEAGVSAERSGDHAAAVEHFVAALDEGGRDPAVYHGLGNALYRLGRRGPAIAAWRRGHRLAPRDGDIAANLARALRETRDRLEPVEDAPGFFFWQEFLSLRESALLAGFFGGLALLAALVRRLRGGARWGWESAVAGVLAALLAASTWAAARRPPEAVVVVDEVVARSTPGPGGVDLFRLHEGAVVRVAERDDGEALVVLPDERKGWVSAAALLSAEPADPFPVEGASNGGASG